MLPGKAREDGKYPCGTSHPTWIKLIIRSMSPVESIRSTIVCCPMFKVEKYQNVVLYSASLIPINPLATTNVHSQCSANKKCYKEINASVDADQDDSLKTGLERGRCFLSSV